MKVCENCGSTNVSIGSPHDERWIAQYECIDCGHCEGIYANGEDE